MVADQKRLPKSPELPKIAEIEKARVQITETYAKAWTTITNECRATSEYSRRYARRTSCKDHAIHSRYAALPARFRASGKGDPEAAAQCRIRRSPRRRFASSSTR